jgi:hypothetical protein
MGRKLATVLRQQALGALALFVALGGTSYAVATGSIDSREIKNSTIRGKDVKNNSLKGADVTGLGSGDIRDSSLLARDFRPGQLPAGPQGLPGQDATKIFAYIRDPGNVDPPDVPYGSGVTRVERDVNDKYTLTFNRSLRNCVVLPATGIGNPEGPPGYSVYGIPRVLMPFAGSENKVEIFFVDAAGSPTPTSFLVGAFC